MEGLSLAPSNLFGHSSSRCAGEIKNPCPHWQWGLHSEDHAYLNLVLINWATTIRNPQTGGLTIPYCIFVYSEETCQWTHNCNSNLNGGIQIKGQEIFQDTPTFASTHRGYWITLKIDCSPNLSHSEKLRTYPCLHLRSGARFTERSYNDNCTYDETQAQTHIYEMKWS